MTAMKALIRSELAVRRYDLKETGLHLCLARNSLKAWLALLSTPTTPAIVPHNQTNASTSSPLPSNTPPPPLPPPQQHQQQPDSSSNNKEKDTALLIDTIHRLYATIHRGSSRAGKNVETFKFLSLLSSSIGNKAATYFQQAYFSLNGGLGAASSFLRMGSLPPLLESNNTA